MFDEKMYFNSTGDVKINAVIINVDMTTGKALSIKRIFEPSFR